MKQPAFLAALDNVTETDTGWIADCPNWGCGAATEISASDGIWRFNCDNQCTHEETVDYLQPGASLYCDQDATKRLWRALMLAPTLEVLEALLKGQNVPRSRLDATWAKRFGL